MIDEAPSWRARRRLGRRGPAVTGLGLGCAPIGNLFAAVSDDGRPRRPSTRHGTPVSATSTPRPCTATGCRSAGSGSALARTATRRLRAVDQGRPVARAADAASRRRPSSPARPELVPHFDFSRDGVLRSIDDSLARFGHSTGSTSSSCTTPTTMRTPRWHEAFPALLRLRDEGVIAAVGCGMNQAPMLERFVADIDLDCVLLAGRYSLLDRSGTNLLATCAEREVGVILGGVFNSGVLADPDGHTSYDYAPAAADVVARVPRSTSPLRGARCRPPRSRVAVRAPSPRGHHGRDRCTLGHRGRARHRIRIDGRPRRPLVRTRRGVRPGSVVPILQPRITGSRDADAVVANARSHAPWAVSPWQERRRSAGGSPRCPRPPRSRRSCRPASGGCRSH